MLTAETTMAVDTHGYLLNPQGERATGFRLDATTGARLRSVAEPLRAPPVYTPVIATTHIHYRVNLPSDTWFAAERGSRSAAMIMDSDAPMTILGCDTAAFLDMSFAGGSIAVFNATGAQGRLSFRWMKSASSDSAPVWLLFYLVNRKATFTAAAWKKAQSNYPMPARAPAAQETNALPDVSINGANFGDLDIIHGPAGVTQFRETLNTVKVTAFTQNGSAAGQLLTATAQPNGDLIARYSNLRTLRYAEVAQFEQACA